MRCPCMNWEITTIKPGEEWWTTKLTGLHYNCFVTTFSSRNCGNFCCNWITYRAIVSRCPQLLALKHLPCTLFLLTSVSFVVVWYFCGILRWVLVSKIYRNTGLAQTYGKHLETTLKQYSKEFRGVSQRLSELLDFCTILVFSNFAIDHKSARDFVAE